jgi:putative hemolysin
MLALYSACEERTIMCDKLARNLKEAIMVNLEALFCHQLGTSREKHERQQLGQGFNHLSPGHTSDAILPF